MTLRIAINGFGRIGRLVCRAIYEMGHDDIELVAVNDPGGNFFPLLKFDSVHGRAPFTVERCGDDGIKINGRRVYRFRSREPEDLHWGDHNVDIVMECTGKFNDREGALTHLKAGAKKVLFSAPAKGEDITVVYGVNHKDIKPEHTIVSNGSCTTNCLAPLAYVLDKEIGIVRGFMTTIHAYTGDQNIIDASHKDPYRARAAGINMIPTTTGAAKALGAVLPNLAGKLDGVAIRVPVPNVSLVDLKFDAARKTTVEEINNAVKKYANGELQGVLSYYEEPLVSSDFNHEPYSANFSVNGTNVIDGTFVRVMAWYDNEWGFSCRMVDTALTMHRAGYK
ncbi:MAG: type I glyceraldehyde-3-phosphate dehydrogenase [Alphaproteobacteria bacterium]|nr:type I glyceraldehyde-3-phosphate dehydrogenase [Alphaproteobacteria bacterium]MBP7757624.1 type I glyceraldehyde-3-phosphate dehydrogenase [Alphaproteobacteria bacterium]MBP7761176.1 type I glyceraldehyde-3-phosphate dehydrogenase [Alphaproteobacteria bacterium]MBP7905141.1 type I glyceraldehyde-3-phosphate dehydrogenase [Alphaproteobacteria bacterium]